MFKYIFFILCLNLYQSSYLPLKKSNGFDDKVCQYVFHGVNYVKPCEEGKYCHFIDHTTSICDDIPAKNISYLKPSCTDDIQCPDGLSCISGSCGCPASSTAIKTSSGYTCQTNVNKDYYYDYSLSSNQYSYQTLRVPGKINFDIQKDSSNNIINYNIKRVDANYRGTVENGAFVRNREACKSGFALFFYLDESLDDTKQPSYSPLELKCVTVNDINYEQKLIKYDNDKIYNVDEFNSKFNSNYGTNYDVQFEEFLMTKLEMFKKYTEVYTEAKQKECESKEENYDEPETCNDNEIRKWRYFYDNPEAYLLYYDEDGNDVANYLIQKEYPTYQASGILTSSVFILSLLLVFL